MTAASPTASPATDADALPVSPARPDRKAPARFRVVVSRVVLVLALLWGAYALAGELLAGRWWLWNGLGLAPAIAHLAVPLFLVLVEALAGTRRPRTFVTTAVALGLGLGQTGVVPYRSGPEVPVTDAGDVVVVGWNTFSWDQGHDSEAFFAYLRSLDADVYLLQEHQHASPPDDRPRPADDLDRVRRELPGYDVVSQGEFLTLSRYPVVDSTALRPEGLPAPRTDWPDYWNVRALRTDVRIGEQTVSLYNTHGPDLLNVNRRPWQPDFYDELRDSAARRTAHFSLLEQDLIAGEHPVVLTGDLNAQPGSADLRWYSTLTDAAVAGDNRYPATFPADLPLWRLDRMYTSEDVQVLDHEILGTGAPYSTHRPIRATVRFP